ncbi:MAG: hypothetical protein RIQ60_2278 [Pseudomonadota bacterium]|jgi:hypothetical protein
MLKMRMLDELRRLARCALPLLLGATAAGAAVSGNSDSLPEARSASAMPTPSGPTGVDRAGAQLYLQGRRVDGSQLQAHRVGLDGPVTGAGVACVTCHRRSAMGMQEGRLLVPPVAGALLFQPGQPQRPLRPGRAASGASAPEPLRHQSRPAYDLASLARALRDGVDPAGRSLDPLMPRFALNAQDVADLAAYLAGIDPRQARGVSADGLHLATVITPDAPAERREALLQTLQRWATQVRLRGLPVRLQVWQLQGPATTWTVQLQQMQARQPVYAVLSGAGRAEWSPVHAFCEAERLPCLLPLVDRLPRAADSSPADNHYTLYYSAGVVAEAQIAARHVLAALPAAQGSVTSAPAVLQLRQAGDALGEAASQAFAQNWRDGSQDQRGRPPLDLAVAEGALARDALAAWLTAAPTRPADSRRSVVMLWLAPAQVRELVLAWPQGLPGVDQVMLSAALTPPDQLARLGDLPPAWRTQLAWSSMQSDPTRLGAMQAMVLAQWLKGLGLTALPGSDQAQVYAATFFFGDALARMRQGWSVDWLMEQLETAVNNRPAGGVYFSLSLGPDQRVAAKTGAVLTLAPDDTSNAAAHPPAQPIQPAEDKTTGHWHQRLMRQGDLLRSDD